LSILEKLYDGVVDFNNNVVGRRRRSDITSRTATSTISCPPRTSSTGTDRIAQRRQ